MPDGTIVVERTDRLLSSRTFTAGTRAERRRGLLDLPALRPGEALIIEPAAQVHTFGMRYAIDVLFCDRRGVVVHVVRNMRPRRISKWALRARYVIELPAGAAADVSVGDRLVLPPRP